MKPHKFALRLLRLIRRRFRPTYITIVEYHASDLTKWYGLDPSSAGVVKSKDE